MLDLRGLFDFPCTAQGDKMRLPLRTRAYFLLMGQSFMKCPIFPQIRQHLSFGASSPSVRTSGSKKYSYKNTAV